jgi:zinc protease
VRDETTHTPPRSTARWTAVAAAILAVHCSSAPQRPSIPNRPLELRTEVESFVLENGVRVVVVKDRNTDQIEIATRYAAGSIEDPDGLSGLAHLVEHLTFQQRVGGESISDRLGEFVLDYNAFTDYDSTHYRAQAHRDQLGRLMEVEYLRVVGGGCRTIPAAVFEREREIVLNEIRAKFRRGSGAVPPLLLKAFYPEGHPYRRPIEGNEVDLANATLADVCRFVEDHYVPSRTNIVVTGNIDVAHVAALAGRWLGKVPAGKGRPATKVPAVKPASARHHVKLATDAALVYAIWRVPARLSSAEPAADLAVEQVRRYLERRATEQGFADSVSASRVGGKRAPAVVFAMSLRKPADAERALAALWESVEDAHDALSEESFAALKRRKLGGLIEGFDSLSSRAYQYADYLQFGGDGDFFIEEIGRAADMTRAYVRKVSSRLFDPHRAVVVMVHPDADADPGYDRVEVAYQRQLHGAAARPDDDPQDAASSQEPLSVPLGRGRKGVATARQFRLDNGLKIVLLPASTVPILDVRLVFAAGNAQEPTALSGVAYFAGEFLSPRTEPLSSAEARAAIEFYTAGGQVFVDVDDDTTTFQVTGLSVYSDVLLRGLEALIRSGDYDDAELAQYAERYAALLSYESSARGRALTRALYSGVYGDKHPYATRGFWSAESLRRIDRSAVDSYRRLHYTAANATLIITGKFHSDEVERQVRRHFSSWKSGRRDQPARVPAQRTAARDGARFQGIDSGDSLTVDIRIAYPTPVGVDRHLPERLVLERMLTNQASAVREELGASYGISATYDINMGPGLIQISGKVDARRAGEALIALRAEVERMRAGGKDIDAAFARARRDVVRTLLADSGSAASAASQLAFIAKHRLPTDFFVRLAHKVARLRPADVAAIIDEELAPARELTVLYGPADEVRRAFDAAGVDPVPPVYGTAERPFDNDPLIVQPPARSSTTR